MRKDCADVYTNATDCSQNLANDPRKLICLWPICDAVSADVKLTHCAEVKVTHLGEDGGLFGAADVDPGASSGNTSNGPKGRECQSNSAPAGMLA